MRTNHLAMHISEKLLILFATTFGVVPQNLSFQDQLDSRIQLAYQDAHATITLRALPSSYFAHEWSAVLQRRGVPGVRGEGRCRLCRRRPRGRKVGSRTNNLNIKKNYFFPQQFPIIKKNNIKFNYEL
jgi:hypothetical protein